MYLTLLYFEKLLYFVSNDSAKYLRLLSSEVPPYISAEFPVRSCTFTSMYTFAKAKYLESTEVKYTFASRSTIASRPMALRYFVETQPTAYGIRFVKT